MRNIYIGGLALVLGIGLGTWLVERPATEAQTPTDYYVATFTGSTKLSVQQPASNARQVRFRQAWFYCAADQAVTLSWNGAAATATAGTAVKIPPTLNTAAANVFTASNVGAGSTTGPVYHVPAGATFGIDLSVFAFGTTGTGTNLNFSPDGSCTMNVAWTEQ